MDRGHRCRPQLYFVSIANSIFSKLDLDLSSHSDLDSFILELKLKLELILKLIL